MFSLRRKKWSVVIIGRESGRVSPPLSGIITFKTEAEAQAWVDERPPPDVTEWRVVKIT